MRKVWISIFILFVFLVSIQDSYAQINRRKVKKNNKNISKYKGTRAGFTKEKQYTKVGFSVNAMNYFGEVAPTSSFVSTDIKFTRPGFTIFGSHRIGPRYTVEAAFSWGTVSSSDFKSANPDDDQAVFRYVRNLSFRNRISELSTVFIADWFENNATYISRINLTPYAFAGLSVFHHDPQARVNEESSLPEAGSWVKLKPLGTEGQFSEKYNLDTYSNWQISIPFGLGVRYRLNQVLDLSFQFGFRFLFFDYIDDISGNYVDLGELDSDLARELSDRSQEPTSAKTNDPRDMNRVAQVTSDQTYVGADGRTYDVFAGYGSDTHPDNIRGNKNNNDLILYTQFRISYIIGGSFMRAKYR